MQTMRTSFIKIQGLSDGGAEPNYSPNYIFKGWLVTVAELLETEQY